MDILYQTYIFSCYPKIGLVPGRKGKDAPDDLLKGTKSKEVSRKCEV